MKMPKTPSTVPVDSIAPSAPADSASAVVPNADNATRSPAQWAEVYFPASYTGRLNDELWKHDVAAQMHGWAHYFARTGKPVLLSKSQYEGAIAAVSGNESKPHDAADYRSRS